MRAGFLNRMGGTVCQKQLNGEHTVFPSRCGELLRKILLKATFGKKLRSRKTKKGTSFRHALLNSKANIKLLEFDSSACFGEFLLDLLGIFLGSAFLDLGWNAFDQLLGVHQGQTGQVLDNLNNVELLVAER